MPLIDVPTAAPPTPPTTSPTMAAVEEVFFDDFQFDLVVDSTAPTGAPSAATTTAASTSTPDSGALEEQDGADFVVVDAGEYAYAFDASYSYSYAGTDFDFDEMIFDADFDFGEFKAPDEGSFDAEDAVLISEPVASDCAASCAGRRRRLRFGSFRGVGDCEC
jgi:hypothetical protein